VALELAAARRLPPAHNHHIQVPAHRLAAAAHIVEAAERTAVAEEQTHVAAARMAAAAAHSRSTDQSADTAAALAAADSFAVAFADGRNSAGQMAAGPAVDLESPGAAVVVAFVRAHPVTHVAPFAAARSAELLVQQAVQLVAGAKECASAVPVVVALAVAEQAEVEAERRAQVLHQRKCILA
jgi:hypothetical protein